ARQALPPAAHRGGIVGRARVDDLVVVGRAERAAHRATVSPSCPGLRAWCGTARDLVPCRRVLRREVMARSSHGGPTFLPFGPPWLQSHHPMATGLIGLPAA